MWGSLIDLILDSREGKLGLDIGSRSTKASFGVGGEVLQAECDTQQFLRSLPDFSHTGVSIVTTGYGREVPGDFVTIPEIRAHVLGALKKLDRDTFTLLDIGGQDYKVIRVENRAIRDFHMNDKCAAGTGRFLEKMADMLSMEIEELGEYVGERKILEATCAVFTETEIIGLMMDGWSDEDLASGVIYSVYERIRPLLRSFPLDSIVFTGGVSRCAGLAETIGDNLGVEVVVPPDPQFMGSLGCLVTNRHRSGEKK